MLSRLRGALERPIDGAPVAVFRIAFGALLFVGTLRLLQKGYVREAFLLPRTFFPPWPFEDVLRPLPGPGMYMVYALIALSALAFAAGLRARVAAGVLCVLFSYAHFIDLTNYLNHYWLVTLLTALFAVVPGAEVRLRDRATMPAWVLWLFRFQIAIVYMSAGAAKLRHDWLFLAQPMKIWLAANGDLALVGPLLRDPRVAYAMSWASAFYDLTIVGWLSWRRSRPFAYATVVVFHLLTARLFNIGMFPYFMMAASLLFLDAGTLRRIVRRPPPPPASSDPRADRRAPILALTVYALVQVLVPMRARLYGGNVLWHEQGYRFAWNVMLMEKMGAAELTVVDRATGIRRQVRLRDHLTASQQKAMATQPDMILAFAHHLARTERLVGNEVAVYADVFVVLNGRVSARLIDPTVDLGSENDSFAPKRWVLPAPE